MQQTITRRVTAEAVGTCLLLAAVVGSGIMGASQGVITIVRGSVPLALFGARGYGAV